MPSSLLHCIIIMHILPNALVMKMTFRVKLIENQISRLENINDTIVAV